MTELEKEELRHAKRMNQLEYQAARYKVGRVSNVSKIITFIVVVVYVFTIIFGTYLIYKLNAGSQIAALFASVTVPAGTTIFVLIQKNIKENTAGGITYEVTMKNLECDSMENLGIINKPEDNRGE